MKERQVEGRRYPAHTRNVRLAPSETTFLPLSRESSAHGCTYRQVKVEGFPSNRLCLLTEVTHWCGPQYAAQEKPGAQGKPAEKWAGA